VAFGTGPFFKATFLAAVRLTPACRLFAADEPAKKNHASGRSEVNESCPVSVFAPVPFRFPLKGEDPGNIKFGNSFTQDGFKGERFDYFASNPHFGERAMRGKWGE